MAVEELEEDGRYVQVETGFNDRMLRSPSIAGAFMEVNLEDGRHFTEHLRGGRTDHSAYLPTDEVKLDVRGLEDNTRVNLGLDWEGGTNYVISPLVLSDEEVEAEIRTTDYGSKKGTFISSYDEEIDSPVIGIEDWTLNSDRSYREEIDHLTNFYGIETDVDELIPSIDDVKRQI